MPGTGDTVFHLVILRRENAHLPGIRTHPPGPCGEPRSQQHRTNPQPLLQTTADLKKPRHQPGTSGTLPAYSGIFFLYNFLVRDPGKWVQCDASAGTGAGSLNPGCCQRGRSGSLILGARGALEEFNPESFSCTIFSYEIPETGVHVPHVPRTVQENSEKYWDPTGHRQNSGKQKGSESFILQTFF